MKKIKKIYYKLCKKILLAIFNHTQTSPLQHYLEEDAKYFYDNYKDPNFDATPYQDKLNPYFLQYGIEEPLTESEYYSQTSGIRSYRYMSRGLAFKLVYSYLERVEFLPAYSDKNIQKRVLCLDSIGPTLDISMPNNVVYNMNGCYFDSKDQEISKEKASEILLKTNHHLILKPAIGSCGGSGVEKIDMRIINANKLDEYLTTYEKDFVFQEVIKQHPGFAAYNSTSVNTVRIVTYRNFDKERKVLFALVRFGGEGAIKDNICSGGGFCMIDLHTGKLKDRKIHRYPIMQPTDLKESIADDIPYFEKIKTAALAMHEKLPHFDVIGWDITADSNGHLYLVEFNVRPGHGLQQGVGPFFEDEEFDKIMEKVSKVKQTYALQGILSFPDKRGFFFK